MAFVVCFMFTDIFPVDVIQENYVRNVRNCIFSVVYPTPFKSRVRLVAVSKVGYCSLFLSNYTKLLIHVLKYILIFMHYLL